MKQPLLKIAAKSLWFNRKDALYQIIIIAILAAIICGSLLAGYSVRKSLDRSLTGKLGKSDLLVSSGTRLFASSLADRIVERTGVNAVSLLENEGYCRNFSTGVTALNTKIYGINSNFFKFHGIELTSPENGTVYINESLAKVIGAGTGDEIILSFKEVDPIPSNAPFKPSEGSENSGVFKISGILNASQGGNFSLGTSQSVPDNIFIGLDDLDTESRGKQVSNRILIQNTTGSDEALLFKTLKEALAPSDIGLSIRISSRTGEAELVSDRIFIDNEIASEIMRETPEATPVLTYLGNSFTTSSGTTPYSFVSALPASMSGITGSSEIVINRWMADDIGAKTGDTLHMTWYDPGMGKLLREKGSSFIVKGIAGEDFIYSDPTLMPDFPGISGSSTCSSWDAGVPILLDRIREKDEEYWNLYKGTPKAFINYETGKSLWGNNFGSATALRYPPGTDTSLIVNKLTGVIDPSKAGFTITNLREKNKEAASEGVDFGSLFLSLSFFIILSCLILLSIALSLFLDSRKGQIRTYHSLGFRRRSIFTIISYETFFISITGAVAGVLLGQLVNILIVKALNSVWTGAVQTRTLTPGFSAVPFLAGFFATVIISVTLITVRLRRYIAGLSTSARMVHTPASGRRNLLWELIFFASSILSFILSFVLSAWSLALSFAGGILLFGGLILALRQFYLRRQDGNKSGKGNYSRLFYSFYPSQAVTPAIFLAAGIFAVIITSANRQVVSDKMLLPAGGTGGYLLWAESAIPVRYNLNSPEGRREYGFDEEELNSMSFVQATRLSGDDASCLNISHVTAPAILGIDPGPFIERGSFSFATRIRNEKKQNPWEHLNETGSNNIIYGIADQTVLQWGLKIKAGDTLKYASESGEMLNIVICAGLQSSVFQGYIIIGEANFEKYFPTSGGSSIFLIDGKRELSELYMTTISDRLSGSGISVEPAIQKLTSFFEVTNTYLEVFMMLGAFGLILGAAGLGFVLKRNFNSRKREFALMLASGYTTGRIRSMLLKDQFIILFWGIFTGAASAIPATWPSVKHGTDLPWILLLLMLLIMAITGIAALLISVNQVDKSRLIPLLRKD